MLHLILRLQFWNKLKYWGWDHWRHLFIKKKKCVHPSEALYFCNIHKFDWRKREKSSSWRIHTGLLRTEAIFSPVLTCCSPSKLHLIDCIFLLTEMGREVGSCCYDRRSNYMEVLWYSERNSLSSIAFGFVEKHDQTHLRCTEDVLHGIFLCTGTVKKTKSDT